MLNFYQKRTLSNTIRLMTILYMLCICQLAIAQTKNFQGVVKDAKGNTLPGVTILETGTSNGVSTNIDGIFEIKIKTWQYINSKLYWIHYSHHSN